MSEINSKPKHASNFIDLTGKVFGRLTVLSMAVKKDSKGPTRWLCVCECGGTATTTPTSLTQGKTKSCGCLMREGVAERNRSHGMRNTPEYHAWSAMWQRCTSATHKAYKRYKDRAPPPEWRSFETFLKELGARPGKGYSLDRIDNNKPYGPGNCRWSTVTEQNRNKSNNVIVVTAQGEVCMSEACEMYGIDYDSLCEMKRNGVDMWTASGGNFDLA